MRSDQSLVSTEAQQVSAKPPCRSLRAEDPWHTPCMCSLGTPDAAHIIARQAPVCQTAKQAPAYERVAADAGAAEGAPSSPLLYPPAFQSLRLQRQYLYFCTSKASKLIPAPLEMSVLFRPLLAEFGFEFSSRTESVGMVLQRRFLWLSAIATCRSGVLPSAHASASLSSSVAALLQLCCSQSTAPASRSASASLYSFPTLSTCA